MFLMSAPFENSILTACQLIHDNSKKRFIKAISLISPKNSPDFKPILGTNRSASNFFSFFCNIPGMNASICMKEDIRLFPKGIIRRQQ